MSLAEDFKRPPAFDKGHSRGSVKKDKVDRRADGKLYVVDKDGVEQLTPKQGIKATLDQVLGAGNTSTKNISVGFVTANTSVKVNNNGDEDDFMEIDAGLGGYRFRHLNSLPPAIVANDGMLCYLVSGGSPGLYFCNGQEWVGPII